MPMGSIYKTFFFLCFSLRFTRTFYVPGVAPVEFDKGDPIEVKAIKLTSVKTQVPYDYYSLPFCQSSKLEYQSENLGEVLRGDRIVLTPYSIKMADDVMCAAVCGKEPLKISASDSNRIIDRIKEEYHAHLIVDNLPSVTRFELPDNGETYYDHGYKLGYVDQGKVYLNTHLRFVLYHHQLENGQYRVVGFEVDPRSAQIPRFDNDVCHLADDTPRFEIKPDQENTILWTYSVRWEESQVRWASRWDSYLAMRDVQIHWFSIVNSIVVVFCLSGFLALILLRTVRRDIANYNRDEDLEEALEETGWKLVHGDVFRPPTNGKLLISLIGTGIQLLGMASFTVFFAMLGMLSPASRGSLMSAMLFLYCFMGLVAGFYSGRLYKTLRGTQWRRAAFQTGALFPCTLFVVGLLMNFFLMGKHSSGAVPFTTMLTLFSMWAGIDLPLVFLGFYFGYRKQTYSHPVRTNQIPRQVPEQPWYLKLIYCVSLSGILPFGAMFIELFFIFSAIWENQFYYLFGFLFLVFIILIISCAQITIVVIYFQLCSENYHWWWRSFMIGGSSALYVFAYSVFYYYTKLEIIGFVPTLLYFAYSIVMSFAFFLLTATVGFYAAYYFICKIYGAVKID